MGHRRGPTTGQLAICLIVPAADTTRGAPRPRATGLPSLAALTPVGHEVTLLVDRGEPLDWARLCRSYDVIALTGTLRQRRRVHEILGERRCGAATICVAGPIVADDELSLEGLCNVRFVGPLEETWPRFIDDLAAGRRTQRRYRRPDLSWLRLSWTATMGLALRWALSWRGGTVLAVAR